MVFILNALSWVACGFVWLAQKSLSFIERKCDAGTPPFRIQLTPSSNVAWATSKKVRSLRDDLISAGFISAGTYEVQELPDTRYMVFVHEASSVIGTIVGTAGKVWLDLSSVFLDGRSLTVSSCEDVGLPRRPGDEIRRVPVPNARAMHEQVRRERAHAIPLAISTDMISALLEQQYARHANWLVERGGYTREEISRVILRGKDPSHPDVFMVRENSVRHALAYWWQLQPDAPAIEARHFHDCITIVHDDLLLESVDYLFSDATGDWEADIKKVPGPCSPREAFAMLNRLRGEPLVRICQKTTPLEADFYCHRALLKAQEAESEELSLQG
jgi:hypothetical protein